MLLVLWLVLWLALTWTNLILVLIASLGCQSPGCTHAYVDWGCLVVGVQCNMEERGRAPLPPRSCHVKVLCRRELGLILKTLFSCLKASHRFKSQEDGSAMIKKLALNSQDTKDWGWHRFYWMRLPVLTVPFCAHRGGSCGQFKVMWKQKKKGTFSTQILKNVLNVLRFLNPDLYCEGFYNHQTLCAVFMSEFKAWGKGGWTKTGERANSCFHLAWSSMHSWQP